MVPASGASGQTAPENTGLGIRLVEAPTALKDDPRARVYIVDHVEAGTTFTRRFEVRNGTPAPLDPKLYVARAAIANGTFGVDRPGRPNELTRWSKVEPSTVNLAPGQSAEARVTIAVPKDAADGEYYGGVVAAVTAPGDIQQESRVAIRIYLAVGEGAVKTDFELTRLTASRLDDGRPLVTAKVRNIGERALDMTGGLKLSNGPGGIKAGPFPAVLGTTLAIGDTEDVKVILDKDTPAGPWDAVLTLRSGTISHAVRARVTFPEIGARPEDVKFHDLQKKNEFGAVAGSLILLILIALLILVWRLRRREREAG